MENYKVEGIVLKTDDFGDANRVITLFTKEFGKIEANAYGCRRVRSSLSGALQMFNHISAQITRGTKIDTIKDADIIHFYDEITKNLERLAYASLLFEIINRMTLPRQSEPEIFRLLKKFLPVISKRDPKIASFIGICQFMETSGVQLNFSRCIYCGKEILGDSAISILDGGAICVDCIDSAQDFSPYPEILRKTFEKMLSFNWKNDTKLNFNSKQLENAEKFLINYVQSLLGSNLRSINFIRELESLKI